MSGALAFQRLQGDNTVDGQILIELQKIFAKNTDTSELYKTARELYPNNELTLISKAWHFNEGANGEIKYGDNRFHLLGGVYFGYFVTTVRDDGGGKSRYGLARNENNFPYLLLFHAHAGNTSFQHLTVADKCYFAYTENIFVDFVGYKVGNELQPKIFSINVGDSINVHYDGNLLSNEFQNVPYINGKNLEIISDFDVEITNNLTGIKTIKLVNDLNRSLIVSENSDLTLRIKQSLFEGFFQSEQGLSYFRSMYNSNIIQPNYTETYNFVENEPIIVTHSKQFQYFDTDDEITKYAQIQEDWTFGCSFVPQMNHQYRFNQNFYGFNFVLDYPFTGMSYQFAENPDYVAFNNTPHSVTMILQESGVPYYQTVNIKSTESFFVTDGFGTKRQSSFALGKHQVLGVAVANTQNIVITKT